MSRHLPGVKRAQQVARLPFEDSLSSCTFPLNQSWWFSRSAGLRFTQLLLERALFRCERERQRQLRAWSSTPGGSISSAASNLIFKSLPDATMADLLYEQVMDTLVRCTFTSADALVEVEKLIAEAAERALPLPAALNTYSTITGGPLRYVAGADPEQLPDKYRLIPMLIHAGSDPNGMPHPRLACPLVAAAVKGDVEAMELLVSHGAKIEDLRHEVEQGLHMDQPAIVTQWLGNQIAGD